MVTFCFKLQGVAWFHSFILSIENELVACRLTWQSNYGYGRRRKVGLRIRGFNVCRNRDTRLNVSSKTARESNVFLPNITGGDWNRHPELSRPRRHQPSYQARYKLERAAIVRILSELPNLDDMKRLTMVALNVLANVTTNKVFFYLKRAYLDVRLVTLKSEKYSSAMNRAFLFFGTFKVVNYAFLIPVSHYDGMVELP